MNPKSPHRSDPPGRQEPDEFEPGEMPVEPDFGPVPAGIPDDPEHDRSVGLRI